MKHNYIKIKASITVQVDGVDIEQLDIDMPSMIGHHICVKAITAAQQKEGFKTIINSLGDWGFTLDPHDYKYVGDGIIEVTFMTRQIVYNA